MALPFYYYPHFEYLLCILNLKVALNSCDIVFSIGQIRFTGFAFLWNLQDSSCRSRDSFCHSLKLWDNSTNQGFVDAILSYFTQ